MNKICLNCFLMKGKSLKWLAMALLSIAMTACAGQSTIKQAFWPPPPDLPRIQFLKGIGDSSDVAETKTLSLFNDSSNDKFIPILKPYGIAVSHGKIYVCDTVQADILIIDLINKKMTRLPGNINAGRLKKPINVAVDEQGHIYVADTSRLEVLQYAPDGTYMRSLGTGKDMKPVDVTVQEDFVFILDQAGRKVLVLDRNSGDFQKYIGNSEEPSKQLSGPTNMASDSKGSLYISNMGNGRIIKMDRDGNYLLSYGKLGDSMVDFGRPRGIAVDNDGLVYVVDAASQQVSIFDPNMRLLMFFGGPGTSGSLNIPAGIAVSTENLDYYQKLAAPGFVLDKVLFVVSQVGTNKINIYGLGKMQGIDYDADVKKTIKLHEQKAAEAEEKERKAEEEKEKNLDKKPSAGTTDGTTPPAK